MPGTNSSIKNQVQQTNDKHSKMWYTLSPRRYSLRPDSFQCLYFKVQFQTASKILIRKYDSHKQTMA